MSTFRPLPHIVSPVAPDLRRFLDRVKESFDDPDGLVTKKDLVDTGIFRVAPGPALEFLDPGKEISYSAPPAALITTQGTPIQKYGELVLTT